jgi:translation initiation factor IF-3
LIAADGENVGVVPLSEAKRQAVENEMDLVEIVPNAEPPVVRVMDVIKKNNLTKITFDTDAK